ncbi:hypothetical protein PoB_001440700, partial [Plakobranchus ocellatus]
MNRECCKTFSYRIECVFFSSHGPAQEANNQSGIIAELKIDGRNNLRWLSLQALFIACPASGGHYSGIGADKQPLDTSRCTVLVSNRCSVLVHV